MKHFLLLFFALSLCAACKPSQKIGKISPVTLHSPSFNGYYQSERSQKIVAAQGGNTKKITFTLKETKDEQKNASDWLKEHNITFPAHAYHDGANTAPLKKMKADDWTAFRHLNYNKQTYHLAQIIEQEDVVLMIYGNALNEMHVITDTWILVVRDRHTKASKYVFDFSNYRMAPEFIHRDRDLVSQDILWAQLEDGILYVSHAHWSYAESSRDMNAYITAIDAAKGEVLWRSQPLVANAVNFAVKGEHIYSAYAFTLENASVYALHKGSGEVVGKIEIMPKSSTKKFIDYIAFKGNDLYVHGYDKTFILQSH